MDTALLSNRWRPFVFILNVLLPSEYRLVRWLFAGSVFLAVQRQTTQRPSRAVSRCGCSQGPLRLPSPSSIARQESATRVREEQCRRCARVVAAELSVGDVSRSRVAVRSMIPHRWRWSDASACSVEERRTGIRSERLLTRPRNCRRSDGQWLLSVQRVFFCQTSGRWVPIILWRGTPGFIVVARVAALTDTEAMAVGGGGRARLRLVRAENRRPAANDPIGGRWPSTTATRPSCMGRSGQWSCLRRTAAVVDRRRCRRCRRSCGDRRRSFGDRRRSSGDRRRRCFVTSHCDPSRWEV